MPDWLAFILLSAPWLPVQVLLHEAAHALAALALMVLLFAGLFGAAALLQRSDVRR